MKAVLSILLLALGSVAALAQEITTAAPRRVVTEIVSGEATRLRTFPGVITPRVETALGFLTTGRIETRPVDLGDVVHAGDVIATLDRITLNEEVASAEADLRAAIARADLAKDTFSRVSELVRRDVAATVQLEQATANQDSAIAAVTAAEADLARARDAAENSTLTATANGVVISVQAEPGSVVTAGTPVVTLATESGREAVIDVPATVAAFLAPGASFSIRSNERKGTPIFGELRLIEPVINATARSRRLRITLETGSDLRLGTLVGVALDQSASDPVLTLPTSALMQDGTIWRVGQGRQLEKISVTLGEALGARVVVTEGLTIGDEVLVRGVHSAAEGQVVGERIEL